MHSRFQRQSYTIGLELSDVLFVFNLLYWCCLQEIELETATCNTLKFAMAYGFRNIQTLIRKVKKGISPYDYVEVMACPSGCLNGGGQAKPAKESRVELLKSVEKAYNHLVWEQLLGCADDDDQRCFANPTLCGVP